MAKKKNVYRQEGSGLEDDHPNVPEHLKMQESEIDQNQELTSELIEEEKEPELMTEKEVHKKFHKFKKP